MNDSHNSGSSGAGGDIADPVESTTMLHPRLGQDGSCGNNTRTDKQEEVVAFVDSFDDVDLKNLPPGRLNALNNKNAPRLRGSGGASSSLLESLQHQGSSSSCPGTPRSRSQSPMRSSNRGTTAGTTATTFDANSSVSSLDDFDSDLLTDRAGFQDDLSESQRRLHSSKEFHCPPTVLERMSEDMLEDVHAFSDVPRSSNASRVSMSNSNGDYMLEPLNECEEGIEEVSVNDDDSVDEAANSNNSGNNNNNSGNKLHHHHHNDETTAAAVTVILTNMENLNMEQDLTSRTGESSLVEEAPSGRTN